MEELLDRIADMIAERVIERLPKPDAALYLSRAEIAVKTGLSPGTVSRIIRQMEAAGYGGIWRQGRNTVRVNYIEFQQYMEEKR